MAVGSTYEAVTSEDVGSLRVNLPSERQQSAIADYLDAETARIDALIEKKQRMVALSNERLLAATGDILNSLPRVQLRRICDLLPGYTFQSDDFSPDYEGARLLRGVNIGVGSLSWDDTVYLKGPGQQYHRYVLRDHDIVLGMDRPFISELVKHFETRTYEAF